MTWLLIVVGCNAWGGCQPATPALVTEQQCRAVVEMQRSASRPAFLAACISPTGEVLDSTQPKVTP